MKKLCDDFHVQFEIKFIFYKIIVCCLKTYQFLFQDQNESEAILKIKQSMEEESKRFEKDSDHPDYFMQ